MRNVVAIALLTLAGFAWAGEATQKKAPASVQDIQGTEKPPPTTKDLPAEKSLQEQKEEGRLDAAKRKAESEARDYAFWSAIGTVAAAVVALLALVIAGVQAWFFWRQLTMMDKQLQMMKADSHQSEQAIETARRSAEAALQTAKGLAASERAYVFVDLVLVNRQLIAGHSPASNNVELNIRNFGKTTALVRKIQATWATQPAAPTVLPSSELPDSELPNAWGIASRSLHTVRIEPRISNETLGQLERREVTLFCFGEIDYDDVMGNKHVTGFCWHLQLTGANRGEFAVTQGSPLNYQKQVEDSVGKPAK